MKENVLATIEQHFGGLTDPRIDRTKLHKLLDILAIAICAIIAGADNWEDVEEFGKARIEWFQSFLELANGIPSHDTFTRVFARLDPEQFQACFLGWIYSKRWKFLLFGTTGSSMTIKFPMHHCVPYEHFGYNP